MASLAEPPCRDQNALPAKAPHNRVTARSISPVVALDHREIAVARRG
jgi:hypothetical protein